MEDARIVELYWARAEQAIAESEKKYGAYCAAIARRILSGPEDVEESVNDTWLAAWDSMPPHRPAALSAFLGKLTRRISIDKWRAGSADKRGGGETALALDELSHCVPSGQDVAGEVELRALVEALDRFLSGLPEGERDLCVCRYHFLLSVSELCGRFGFSQSKVKSMLARTRKKLLTYLEKEGLR